MYSLLFAVAMLLSIFTPYMLYFAIFCIVFVFLQPHLRFVIKSLPRLPLSIVSALILAGMVTLVVNIIHQPEVLPELLTAKDFSFSNFLHNIMMGITPVFSWDGSLESVFMTPLIGLPTLALALVGLFSTTKGFFASRNMIASLLFLFTIIITGFNPNAIIFLILPLAILIAHGLKYLLEKWYGLFPENPYARIAAIIPLSLLFVAILLPSLLQYVYGYRYNPSVAGQFSQNLTIIRKSLKDEVLLVQPDDYEFYRILEDSTSIDVATDYDSMPPKIAVLNDTMSDENYTLERIITSPMRENSDIIYLYTVKGE